MTLLVKPFNTDVRLRELVPYDTIYPEVFQFVGDSIKSTLPYVEFEHIGSTSVPGLGAKPFVDILVLCKKRTYVSVLQELEKMGFHDGQTPVDTPEKPLRCGRVEFCERVFNVILHLTPKYSRIHRENVRFREELKANPDLAREYEKIKAEAFRDGVVNPREYNKRKHAFIESVIYCGDKD